MDPEETFSLERGWGVHTDRLRRYKPEEGSHTLMHAAASWLHGSPGQLAQLPLLFLFPITANGTEVKEHPSLQHPLIT